MWADINYTFVLQFEAWLNGQGYARNTVIKHLRNLRTLINEAIACGYIHSENNPFKNFKIPAQMSRHKFLSHEDLNRLETMRLEGRLKHIRDAFLFCCYTGLRFSDFCLLRTEMFVHEGGYLWLKMSLKKTSTQVCIPLNCLFDGKGVEILEGYDSVETFARIGSNSKVNAALKNIQRKAGIITHLTFHLARHTCATLLCYQGVPITTIQKILGHSRIGTTQIYQEVLTETMIKDLMSAR